MGWGELGFAGLMAVLGLVFMLLVEAGKGTGGLIRSATGDIAAAREQYDAEKGRNVWLRWLEGRDNQSFERIDGEYPVRGPWREMGLLVKSAQVLGSVCRQASCNWYADHAVLVRGKPETTTATTIVADRAQAPALLAALRKAESAGRVFVTGTLKAHGVRVLPPTIEVADDTVRLSYAEPPNRWKWHSSCWGGPDC